MLKLSQLFPKREKKVLFQKHGSTECLGTCADLLHLRFCHLEDGNGFSFFKCMKYEGAVCSIACGFTRAKEMRVLVKCEGRPPS